MSNSHESLHVPAFTMLQAQCSLEKAQELFKEMSIEEKQVVLRISNALLETRSQHVEAFDNGNNLFLPRVLEIKDIVLTGSIRKYLRLLGYRFYEQSVALTSQKILHNLIMDW